MIVMIDKGFEITGQTT